MRRMLGIGIITCLVGGFAVLGAGPASAKCIRGEVAVHWTGQSDQTVWPESYCLYETGGDDVLIKEQDVNVTGLPTGTPSGVRAKVWVPIP